MKLQISRGNSPTRHNTLRTRRIKWQFPHRSERFVQILLTRSQGYKRHSVIPLVSENPKQKIAKNSDSPIQILIRKAAELRRLCDVHFDSSIIGVKLKLDVRDLAIRFRCVGKPALKGGA
ncbi:hypothetical protein KIW84_072005 [Lathyrus oleraceus]|uniref:Uncharacterized protein n=1 Tax=Pisum sativum TaxID=3888 RepID=A0A9D4ZVG7_PEA|nr:hypothetical protein KIW84_072005 [Pisum sativum]